VGIVFLVIAAVAVFAIAAAAVGTVTQRLAVEHPATVFSVEEAVKVIGDDLDDERTARLSYDDVRRVVRWYVEYLDANELTDEEQYDEGDELIVIDDADVLAHLQARAEGDPVLEPGDVTVVHDGIVAYVEAIGAVGREVTEPVDEDRPAPPAARTQQDS
jgi:hypothetical protein